MENGAIEKSRGPMPEYKDKILSFSAVPFQGAEIYRAIAGRARDRAEYYYKFVIDHCNVDNPDFSSSGFLEVYVTWASFACEVFFKSILFNIEAEEFFKEDSQGKKRIQKHNLWKLYEDLKKADRVYGTDYSSRISDRFENFEKQLKETSDYFIKFRYDFEMSIETINYTFVFALMKNLHSVVNDISFVKSTEIFQDENGWLNIS